LTGRELIIYISKNHLEDQEVLKDGIFIGLMDEKEAALKFGVGTSTIRTWWVTRQLPGFCINDTLYFFRDAEDPRKNDEER
jgi:hypothetical protein